MLKALPTKETEMISITSTHSPKEVPTPCLTPGSSLRAEIEAFLEMQTEALKVKPVTGNVNET